MFWWFEKDGEYLRIEVLELASNEFELRVIRANGVQTIETYSNAQDLAKRQDELQRFVRQEGWTGPHSSVM